MAARRRRCGDGGGRGGLPAALQRPHHPGRQDPRRRGAQDRSTFTRVPCTASAAVSTVMARVGRCQGLQWQIQAGSTGSNRGVRIEVYAWKSTEDSEEARLASRARISTKSGHLCRVITQTLLGHVQGGSPKDADAVALELAGLVDRLGCGWCLVWAKHDSLVAAVKATSPELDVRPACSIERWALLREAVDTAVVWMLRATRYSCRGGDLLVRSTCTAPLRQQGHVYTGVCCTSCTTSIEWHILFLTESMRLLCRVLIHKSSPTMFVTGRRRWATWWSTRPPRIGLLA